MRIALVLPPLTQLNTPYPGPAYLARFLRDLGEESTQWDLGLELVGQVFSRPGLAAVFDTVEAWLQGQAELPGAPADGLPEPVWTALALRRQHEAAVDAAIDLLRGQDSTLAARVAAGGLLPPTPRLQRLDNSAFGPGGMHDLARHRATRYLADLADLVAHTVDPGFSLARYQHHLAHGPVSFDPIAQRLAGSTLVDGWLDALLDAHLDAAPDVEILGLSVPFPGTLYGALRLGRRARQRGLQVWLGGGYVSTELREVDEPRLWSCVDALVYDDGEGPLQALLEHHAGGPDRRHRTRTRDGLHGMGPDSGPSPARPASTPAAWYGDLDLGQYLQVVDSTNPAHRLWGDGRWNKLTLAHGCYWKRCAFCDVQLDYIARFEPARITALLDAMEELIAQTGQRGFHIVDEAAPPRLMRDLALGILGRGLAVSWWGNIRFERAFTPDLCRLLAASGLTMVTGGLEVASDRLLDAMDKGITVQQAARAAAAFRKAGVRVHAYLMYGFPTQTDQETVDSMELVRQLFAVGALDSAFWHRFVLTRHSGIMRDPGAHGVVVEPVPAGVFATNDLPHQDPSGGDHDRFDQPLEQALDAWMRGQALELPVSAWLDPDLPQPSEPSDRIQQALARDWEQTGDRLVWLGGEVLEVEEGLALFGGSEPVIVQGSQEQLQWLGEVLEAARPGGAALKWSDAREVFPGGKKALRRVLRAAREAGLVRV